MPMALSSAVGEIARRKGGGVDLAPRVTPAVAQALLNTVEPSPGDEMLAWYMRGAIHCAGNWCTREEACEDGDADSAIARAVEVCESTCSADAGAVRRRLDAMRPGVDAMRRGAEVLLRDVCMFYSAMGAMLQTLGDVYDDFGEPAPTLALPHHAAATRLLEQLNAAIGFRRVMQRAEPPVGDDGSICNSSSSSSDEESQRGEEEEEESTDRILVQLTPDGVYEDEFYMDRDEFNRIYRYITGKDDTED